MKKCPLCSYEFANSAASACAACPMGGSCNTVCCPHCGYRFVTSSKTLDILKDIFKRGA